VLPHCQNNHVPDVCNEYAGKSVYPFAPVGEYQSSIGAGSASGHPFLNRCTRSGLLMKGRPKAIRSAWLAAIMFSASSCDILQSTSFLLRRAGYGDRELDIWETEYGHVMDSPDAIVDWIASRGLRPFLATLDTDEERAEFVGELTKHVHQSYETRIDGKVQYPFRRKLVIAYR